MSYVRTLVQCSLFLLPLLLLPIFVFLFMQLDHMFWRLLLSRRYACRHENWLIPIAWILVLAWNTLPSVECSKFGVVGRSSRCAFMQWQSSTVVATQTMLSMLAIAIDGNGRTKLQVHIYLDYYLYNDIP